MEQGSNKQDTASVKDIYKRRRSSTDDFGSTDFSGDCSTDELGQCSSDYNSQGSPDYSLRASPDYIVGRSDCSEDGAWEGSGDFSEAQKLWLKVSNGRSSIPIQDLLSRDDIMFAGFAKIEGGNDMIRENAFIETYNAVITKSVPPSSPIPPSSSLSIKRFSAIERWKADLEEENEDLNNTVARMEKEVDRLRHSLKSQEKLTQAKTQVVESLSNTINKLEAENMKLEESKNKSQQNITELSSAVVALQSQVDELAKLNEGLQDRNLCWAPASINRLYNLISGGHVAFWLTLFHVFFAGLWGLVNAVVYGFTPVIRKVTTQSEEAAKSRRQAMRQMMYYPLTLVVCWAPASINRLYNLISGHVAFWLTLFHIFFAGLWGLVNAVVYGFTPVIRDRIYNGLPCTKKPPAVPMTAMNL